MSEEPQSKYNIIQPLLLASVMAIGIMIGFKISGNKNNLPLVDVMPSDSGIHSTGRVEELLRFIESKYVDSIGMDTLLEDAIYAVIDNLDPHSEYLTPSEVEDINNQMEGQFVGLGIELIMSDDTATIYRVMNLSPAKTAGLKTGDKIMVINGTKVSGISKPYDEIRALLKHPKGEKIQLNIKRENNDLPISLILDEIPVSSIGGGYNVNDSVMYIKIDRFGSKTYSEFMTKVEALFGESKSKHLILDVRGNPGGYLPEATNILCQIFEEKNRILVTTKAKNKQSSEYKTTGKRFFNIQRVVVLVDENSASASEIIAGAIQDWDRGIIVGRRTFGKGLVQEQYDLKNGGAIRLTVARYYTPSGRSIQKSYQDKEKYEDDLYARAQNGDYFHSNSDGKKDTVSIFKSLIMGKKLHSGGGITPDIFVPLDSSFLLPAFQTIEPELIKYYLKNKNRAPFQSCNTYKTISDFTLSQEEFSRLVKFVGVEVSVSDQQKMLPLLERYVKMVMSHVFLDEENITKMDNQLDITWQKSLQVLTKGNK